MPTETFDKRMVIDEEAAQQILSANVVVADSLKNADRKTIKNHQELMNFCKKLKDTSN